MFRRIFSIDEAVRLYNILYSKDQNPYTLQQKALCQSLFGDYKNAFQSIDKALSIMPNNFSFRNSQAIIMFEANKSTISAESVSYMKKAMEILKQCYIDDSTGYDQNQVEYENAAPCSCVQREAAKAQGTAGRIQASMRTMLQQKVFGVYLCR